MYPSAHTIQIPCHFLLLYIMHDYTRLHAFLRTQSTYNRKSALPTSDRLHSANSCAESSAPALQPQAMYLRPRRKGERYSRICRPPLKAAKGRMPLRRSHSSLFRSICQSLVLNLHNGGAAHAAADAQGGQAGLRALGLHLMEQGHQDTASGSAHGMSQSDSAAVGVQLLVYIYP